MLLLLVVVLSALLNGDFVPGSILFSNDGPLGRLMSQCHRLPDGFTGSWQDLNTVGYREGSAAPSISGGLRLLLGPVWFAKLYAPAGLLILGLAAWFFFRRSGLAPAACVLGGLAATLNSSFFSAACWGVAAHPITFAMSFLALAALVDTSPHQRWLRLVLAGFALGMGVTEGADIGALFSLLVASFIVYQAWIAPGSRTKNVAMGVGRVVAAAVCAAFLATQAISGLIATNIEGVAGAGQDTQTKAAHWDWATQWSLPKREALSVFVPGLFGYRLDTPDGGAYWGGIGRDPVWDRYEANGEHGPAPAGFTRYSGGGVYAGVVVALLAIWTSIQSLRGKDSVFNLSQRKLLWFWLAVGVVSLLLAFGRFAPFYRLLYALPYFSTIRNPVKFMHMLSFALIVLFAYAVDSLWREYMQRPAAGDGPEERNIKESWAGASRFEKRWVMGCLAVCALSLIAWLAYGASRDSFEHYLQSVQISEYDAPGIAGFSIREVGWFVFLFAASAGLVTLILSRTFAGARARWGLVLLGSLLVLDLARANQPWILFWDRNEKYASNPIIDRLKDTPYEHRVALLGFRPTQQPLLLDQVYRVEWLQHQFPYYNVQSLDNAQMPRMPEDLKAFQEKLSPTNLTDRARLLGRFFQLTNTRYVLGSVKLEKFLNQRSDPGFRRFHIVERFDIQARPGILQPTQPGQLTAALAADGDYAVYEFTGALPRAKMYGIWQVSTNDQGTLDQLAGPSFDPEQTVIVAGGVPAASAITATNQTAGTVEIASYAPRDIVLKSDAPAASVLLLNDRFDPNWTVWVDGKPDRVLRCNYLMRGVYLPPGEHTIHFRFRLPSWTLAVSLTATAIGLCLIGVVVVTGRRNNLPIPTPPPNPPAASMSPPAREKKALNGTTRSRKKNKKAAPPP
jgi:hypothetical protein